MLASLIAAVVAALCYGVASVMQAVAVRAASRRPAGAGQPGSPLGRVDPGLVVRMLRQWRFLVSLVLDLGGFLAQLVALRRLPLFAVQAIVAGNLAVTALGAAWVMKARLARREWLAVGGVIVGVGLLGTTVGAEGASGASAEFKLALPVAVGGVAVAGVAASRLRRGPRTLVLGAVAGLGFGLVAIAARVLPGYAVTELLRDPAAYAVAAAGVVSFVLYAAALENGSVTVATAALVLAETAPPALIGVVFLGDHPRRGTAALAVGAFVLAVASAVLLARFGEAGDDATGRPGVPARRPDGTPSTSTAR